jgi:alkylhydroperoxidase family enzyme
MFLESKRPPARIAPLEPPYAPAVAEQLAGMMPPGVEPIGLFRTFARNLPMTSAMRGWGGYVLGRRLSLPLRLREIAIDRTCARCGCEYEWGVHIAYFAERAGLSPEQVTSLTHGDATDACWTDDADRVVIDVADALHDDAQIDDALWRRTTAQLTDIQVLDLLLLCGWYHAISYAANGAAVALEPWAPRFAGVTA